MPETRARLLAEAEVLLRTKGYAAFSYADLAERIAIRKASIHHHFPTKEAMLAALVDDYLAKFVATLADLATTRADARERLRAYSRLFLDGMERGLLPLCGALAAERAALPASMRPVIARFFQLHIDWLVEQIEEGIASGVLEPDVDALETAHLLLGALEGGSFVAWALDDNAPVLSAFETALRNIETAIAPQRTTPASRRHSPGRST
ncbi:TetR/AcrR family transcriptional regulator [Lysobacter sp. A6]|uniref:TetR/AcrR family transcriptional regulator n=1 Tax=Noviluteimonas lactosilytica TaxID=2888523 RepID=A0ABS8JGC5_9GAMM|nr:TetR/AcrR family transcriptional regulator [Lysobacter lactosilyticus]MCC8362656.1 TetR/AcrR family transcriptional regulator [Lysobacter lactosilyticus]